MVVHTNADMTCSPKLNPAHPNGHVYNNEFVRNGHGAHQARYFNCSVPCPFGLLLSAVTLIKAGCETQRVAGQVPTAVSIKAAL
jgi:hypothetical protein